MSTPAHHPSDERPPRDQPAAEQRTPSRATVGGDAAVAAAVAQASRQQDTVRERLGVPVAWWLVAAAVAFTLVVAVGAYTSPLMAGLTALVCLLAIGSLFASYGSAVVQVDEAGVAAGGAHVEWPWVARVEPLDAAQMRQALGPGAKVTAHFVVRPYIRTGVRVVLDDPADPHPEWLVSTRRPKAVATAAGVQLARHARHAPGAATGQDR